MPQKSNKFLFEHKDHKPQRQVGTEAPVTGNSPFPIRLTELKSLETEAWAVSK